MAKPSFDKAMKQLEEIVHELELGELPLEKAVVKFEEGIQLANYCGELLDKTEQKITLLLKDRDGKIHETPFLPPDNNTDETK